MQISPGESKLIPAINVCYKKFSFLEISFTNRFYSKEIKKPFFGDVNIHRRQWNQDFCLNFTFISNKTPVLNVKFS